MSEFSFADDRVWGAERLEYREAELRENDGGWLRADRRAAIGREMAHIMFELDKRYAEQDVLDQLREVVERGVPEPETA